MVDLRNLIPDIDLESDQEQCRWTQHSGNTFGSAAIRAFSKDSTTNCHDRRAAIAAKPKSLNDKAADTALFVGEYFRQRISSSLNGNGQIGYNSYRFFHDKLVVARVLVVVNERMPAALRFIKS